MPKEIYEFIESARSQLPEAFSSQNSYPWPDKIDNLPELLSARALYPWPEMINDVTDEVLLPPDFPLPRSLGEGVAEPIEIEELNQEISQKGTEALAIYVSFHNPLPDASWGIFLLGEPMWRLREEIRQLLLGGDLSREVTDQADWLASDLVKYHEYYHFRVDLYTLHQELILRKPLYLPYMDHVYPMVWCTSDCFEEALANLALRDHARNPARRRFRRLALVPRGWYKYAVDFCNKQPPGYRDYRRPRELMKQGLGGQLYFGSSTTLLPAPQSEWVGLHPPGLKRDCPVYLVQRISASKAGLQLTLKYGGNVWRFHRYDVDIFPSVPHGHNLITGEKLNPYTGEIFSAHGRIPIGRLSAEDLKRVQSDITSKWPDIAFN